jgi:hypothetical protein
VREPLALGRRAGAAVFAAGVRPEDGREARTAGRRAFSMAGAAAASAAIGAGSSAGAANSGVELARGVASGRAPFPFGLPPAGTSCSGTPGMADGAPISPGSCVTSSTTSSTTGGTAASTVGATDEITSARGSATGAGSCSTVPETVPDTSETTPERPLSARASPVKAATAATAPVQSANLVSRTRRVELASTPYVYPPERAAANGGGEFTRSGDERVFVLSRRAGRRGRNRAGAPTPVRAPSRCRSPNPPRAPAWRSSRPHAGERG